MIQVELMDQRRKEGKGGEKVQCRMYRQEKKRIFGILYVNVEANKGTK